MTTRKSRQLRDARGLMHRAVRELNDVQGVLILLADEFGVDERDTAFVQVAAAIRTLADLRDAIGNIPGVDPLVLEDGPSWGRQNRRARAAELLTDQDIDGMLDQEEPDHPESLED